MSVEEVSSYFLGGVPIQYFGLDPIDPRSSRLVTPTFGIGTPLCQHEVLGHSHS